MNILWTAVILPFMALSLKKELMEALEDWGIYKHRPFDLDRDPESEEVCLMPRGDTGSFTVLVVIHEYSYSFWRPTDRNVRFSYVVKGQLKTRTVSLKEWKSLPKTAVDCKVPGKTRELLLRHSLWLEA